MKKTIYLILGLIIITTTGCSAGSATPGMNRTEAKDNFPDNYVEYTDTGFGYHISFPENWKTTSIVKSSVERAREAIPKIESGKSIDKVTVLDVCPSTLIGMSSYEYPWLFITIDDSASELSTAFWHRFDYLVGITDNFEEISRSETIIDEMVVMILEYKGTTYNKKDIRSLILMTIREGYVWEIDCISYADRYEDWAEDFHTIIESFEFID